MLELAQTVVRHTQGQTGTSPVKTAIAGLTLLRAACKQQPDYFIHKPALCIVVQGAKWEIFGDERIDYGAGQALVVSIEMPVLGQVAEASLDKPYLGVVVEFDIGIMQEVMETLSPPPQMNNSVSRGVFVSDFGGPLADCVLRLVRLLDTPYAIAALYPLAMREICYWLLTGPHGSEIAGVALGGSHAPLIIHAIHALRSRFAQTVRIEELATGAQMSTSAFHRQFKRVTSITPLQYQKQLRLLEARRLMVADAASAETAAYQVGYESTSQFSREYARMFGAPPRRDVTRIQRGAVSPPGIPPLHGPAQHGPRPAAPTL